jgi:uracil-DNA glycosylase
MQSDIRKLLKPEAIRKFRDKSQLLNAPLSVFNFVSDDQVKKLNAAKITTVRDLSTLRDASQIGVAIDQASLETLICALFYPQHDPGPNCRWERLFQSAPLDRYITFPGTPFHTHFGPVFYRGRLDGTARVLVIGQDPSSDETLAGRIFVGTAGQLAQNLLTRLGLTRSYLMFNTFLFGVQSSSITPALTSDSTIVNYRNSLFDRAKATNSLTCIVTFGTHAATTAANWPGKGTLPVVNFMHPTAPSGVAANWNSHFAAAHGAIVADGDGTVNSTPYSTTAPLPSTDIPRRDLPFGLPAFHGAGGATRSFRVSTAFETQITWTAP